MKGLIVMSILGLTLFVSSSALAFFNPNKLIEDIDGRLDSAKEELSKVNEAVEKKSDELLKMIDEEVEEGLFRIDELSEKVEGKVGDLKQELGDLLSSEQFQKIEELLNNLNGELIDSIREGIVSSLEERLGVSTEQLEKLGPIFGDNILEQGKLLAKYLTLGGPAALAEFAAENEKVRQASNAAIEEILSPEQMEELGKWRQELDEKIEGLFPKEE